VGADTGDTISATLRPKASRLSLTWAAWFLSRLRAVGRRVTGLYWSLRGRFRVVISGPLGLLAVAQAAPVPVYALLSLLTVVILSPARRGEASLIVGSASIGGTLVFGSMHVGAVMAVHGRDVRAVARVICITLGLSVICLVVGALCWVYPSFGIGLYRGRVAGQCLLGVGLTVPFLFATRTLQGLGLARSFSRLMLLQVAVYFTATTTCLVVLNWRSPLAITIPWLGATALALIPAAVGLARLLSNVPWRDVTVDRRVNSIMASLAAHGGSSSQQLGYRADLFLLGAFASASSIGYYSVATAMAEIVWVVPEVIALSVFADERVRAGAQWARVVDRRIRQAIQISAIVGLAVVAGAAVLLLVALPRYADSFPLLLMLLPGIVASASARVTLAALTARDERRLISLGSAATLAVACLYVPAIALGGVAGAAMGSTVIYIGGFALAHQLWKKAKTCTT